MRLQNRQCIPRLQIVLLFTLAFARLLQLLREMLVPIMLPNRASSFTCPVIHQICQKSKCRQNDKRLLLCLDNLQTVEMVNKIGKMFWGRMRKNQESVKRISAKQGTYSRFSFEPFRTSRRDKYRRTNAPCHPFHLYALPALRVKVNNTQTNNDHFDEHSGKMI